MLNERLQRMKNKYFDTTPSITAERLVLATEAHKKFAGDAIPIFRARIAQYVMENMTTLVLADELIVGTPTNEYRGANLFPEYTSSSWLIEDIDDFPVRKTDPYNIKPEDRETILETLKYWKGRALEDLAPEILPDYIENARQKDLISVGCRNGVSGETTPNHKKFLNLGLRGFIAECRENIDRVKGGTKEKQEQVDFWKACIIICEGMITYAHRMAEEAEKQAGACTDQKRKAELMQIAENCRVVPENPPQSFHQAVQMIWFIQVAFHIEAPTTACGFGRFDQYMYPFYQADLEAGKITEAEALELIECFYLKCCEVYEVRDRWYSKSFAGYPMWEILMVGGQTTDGKDATNDLSYLCLEAGSDLQTTQPVLAVRVHEGTPEKLFRKGAEMMQAGMANPGFFNDDAAIPMVLGKGCTMEEARDWNIVGCIQPAPGGGTTDSSPDAGYVNAPKVLELVLHNGRDPKTGEQLGLQTGEAKDFKDVKELTEAVKKQLIYFYQMIKDGYDLMVPYHMLRLPVIFASMAVDGCVELGKSVQEGGAKYSTAGMFITGAANLADSLVAIEEVVYKDKTISMDELITALDNNFQGNERLRQLLINKPPKFGNDNEYVDGVARDILGFVAETVQQWEDSRHGHYSFCNLSQTVNISHGEVCGATPDGRLAGQPYCDNSSPTMGRDICGPTATVKSVAAIDQKKFHDGALFNIRFDPKGISGEKGLQTIEGVIKTYFKHGGEHIQINVVDDETLRKAQEKPEDYKGLMVRVAGYMAYFTELDKAAQDTIIDRTAHLKIS
ncbi:glycyl radical protein [Aminipila luticellarii]|uniref:Formate C-acetyltransferase/glycerol dehydratase family glycyl radical enzyme n=1 Tax=Aminipila luticellarii TaxID=2507160 RepID=A0A410PWV4_9FIRM|nr:formate C-acetyltransferase/glycerol dehydratase family glycyl radical enzyme [Aminipila luticellarii]QAT43419.1 formate C-acetyltransferase/glycerol dehydratase family glycyl radical enzyme [Aminipila luticellarii]